MITYNAANLPTAYRTLHDSGTRTYGMSYYLNGNKYQETNTLDSVTKTYAYNTAGQLSSESATKNNAAVYSASYTYTPYGNRAQMSYTSGGTTEVTDYTYDGNNRLTNEATSVNNDLKSAVRYYYDRNGNTTAEQKSVYTTTGTQSSNMSMSGHSGGSTMKLYRYDEFNRLVEYHDDGVNAEYTYGVDNLRATKTVNGATTSYVWNGQNLASETKNDTTTVYYYDPLGVNGAKTDNDTFVRYIKDPHGNAVATSKSNTLFGTYDYTAFGNQLEATDTTNPFRYCGEYYDEESGLTYLRNRYYNSTTGRFLTEDPIQDGVNWYVYCGANPINNFDSSGLEDINVEYFNMATLTNVEDKATGVYASLRSISENIKGSKLTWTAKDNGGVAEFRFDWHIIQIVFNNLNEGEYAAKVRIFYEGYYGLNEVTDWGRGDNVADKLSTQEAYFYLKKDEHSDSLVVQAKVSTMFYCARRGSVGDNFIAAWNLGKKLYENFGQQENRSLQDYLNDPKLYQILNIDSDAVLDVYENVQRERGYWYVD